MRYINIFIGFLVGFLLLSLMNCTSSKNLTPTKNITSIDYRVEESKKVADSIMREVESKPSGIERNSTMASIKKMENPPPSFYRLIIKDEESKTEYKEALQKEQSGDLIYTSMPFHAVEGYNFKDSTALYMDYSSVKSGVYMKIPKQKFQWQKTDRDSVIQGIKVDLRIGRNENSLIKAWITKEYEANLNVHDIYNPEGFVLAFELIKENDKIFEKSQLKVFPEKIKKINKDFKVPLFEKEYSWDDILKLYQNN